eukprot:545942_1
MSDWSLNIQSSATPYSFWSFGRYGHYGASNGRNTTNISDATLGVYQTHPLSFKATEDGLIIEGADKPSKQIIEWKVNNKGRFKVFTANIIQAENGNKTIIELVYSDSKYTFELKNMEMNKRIQSITTTDLDLIIRENLNMDMSFDVLTLICDYNQCIFDMNRDSDVNRLEYHQLSKPTDANTIDTTKAARESHVKLKMKNEHVNGTFDQFMVECECKPIFARNMGNGGIVSLHGPGTGWELRVSNRHCFDWLFTTNWVDASGNTNWQHNELTVDVNDIDNVDITDANEWIYLKGEYDFVNGLESFTVNDRTISRAIKGKPQVETRRGVEFGRGYGSNGRKYYGLIRNVKIDGWNVN